MTSSTTIIWISLSFILLLQIISLLSHSTSGFTISQPTQSNQILLLRDGESLIPTKRSSSTVSRWSRPSKNDEDDHVDKDTNTVNDRDGDVRDGNVGDKDGPEKKRVTKYVLGNDDHEDAAQFWSPPNPVNKNRSITTDSTTASPGPAGVDRDVSSHAKGNLRNVTSSHQSSTDNGSSSVRKRYNLGNAKNPPVEYKVTSNLSPRTLIAKDRESQYLSRALFQYEYGNPKNTSKDCSIIDTETDINEIAPSNIQSNDDTGTHTSTINPEHETNNIENNAQIRNNATNEVYTKQTPPTRYEDIDLSIPLTVYNPQANIDLVWDLLRYEAEVEAQREPLLVSFLYSTILNHFSLESALAFHLANRVSSPSMMSTQIMGLIMEAAELSPTFCRDLRADIIAVRDRDPACTCLPDVFLHFKGFHALQTHRVANFFWKSGRTTLAHYLQSQVSQNFQIDIHPNATLSSGIMLDHGTGIVIGETAVVGENCSILHHVTLGGSGKRGVDRHPKVGKGVLLGAGASILGNIKIGDGCQVGAGTLVIGDLPAHCVAVGVPAKVIGKFRDEGAEPGRSMNQVGTKESEAMLYIVGDGI